MSALAEATTPRVEIGSWVMCVGFRNPALLAKMAVTLDEVSEGRLILGLGAGNQRGEFDSLGFDFDRRIGRFDEAIRVIAPLLRVGQVDFDGTYFQVRDCEIAPRGPRPSGPPILIGADGPRMLRLGDVVAPAAIVALVGDAGTSVAAHTGTPGAAQLPGIPSTVKTIRSGSPRRRASSRPTPVSPVDGARHGADVASGRTAQVTR